MKVTTGEDSMETYLIRVDMEPTLIVVARDGRQAMEYAKQKVPIWKGITAEPLTVAVERGSISDTLQLAEGTRQ